MGNDDMRTHVVMPRSLVDAVDELVGQRRRSQFVTEAVQRRVAQLRRDKALSETAGILRPEDHPEWATPELVSAWVRASRSQDEERFQRKLGGRSAE